MLDKEVKTIRNSILDGIIIAIACLGLPNVIIAFYTGLQSGHFPYISITGYLIVLFLVFFMRKIPFAFKAWIIIVLIFLIALRGLANEGLLSHSMLLFLIITMIGTMLLGRVTGIIILIVNSLTYVAFAYAFQKHYINYPFDINTYFNAPETWIGFIIVTIFLAVIMMYIFLRLDSYLMKYINDLTINAQQLHHANTQLEEEIDEKKKTEQALIQNENKFRNVFNSVQEGIIICDINNQIIDVNNAFINLTGRQSKEAILTTKITDLFSNYNNIGITSSHTILGFNKNESLLTTRDKGIRIPVEITISPFINNSDKMYVIVIKDIRERKESSQKILKAMIDSEERERMRIAQDLHDDAGPLLSAARLYLDSLEVIDNNKQGINVKQELMQLMSKAISVLRDVSGNLSSHLVNIIGLKRSINKFIDQILPSHNIEVSIEIPEILRLTHVAELSIYRVFTELITNSLKHSGAKKIHIGFEQTDKDIKFHYMDDGIGIDLEKLKTPHSGMGLYNIYSRIQSMGGEIILTTSPGNGLSLSFSFISDIVKPTTDS